MKNNLKDILPPMLIRNVIGLFYGWHGNYKSWEEAKKKSTGNDNELILEKTKIALL